MSHDVTSVALVGHGYWGPKLLRNYMDLPGAEVKWVCDKRKRALEKIGAHYPSVAVTTDYDDVLADDDLDAVLVATPISTHYKVAKAALEAGKHVFVEKPLTDGVAKAEELVEIAQRGGLTLMVGHTFLFSPPVRMVHDLIKSGEIGEVRFVTASRVNLGLHQTDASVIWDLAAHDLSILYYWLGEAAETVSVIGRGCVRPTIPDVAFLNLRFPSGVVASVNVSWLAPMKLRRTVVVGSEKMLLYDDTENVEKVKVFDHGVELTGPTAFEEDQLIYRTGDIVAPKIDGAEPLGLEAAHFVECIQTGRRPLTDGRFGVRVVAALEAAELSLADDGRERQTDPAPSGAR